MTYATLCDHCRAREAGHAEAALSVLSDDSATANERTIASQELASALTMLRLAPGVPMDRDEEP
jgi:hypothetical protein